jgi:chromosome segregation ATPase
MANHRTFTDQDLLDAAASLEKLGKPINGNALRRIVGSGRPSSLMDAYNELVNKGKVQLPEKAQQEVEAIESYDLPMEIREELEMGLQAISGMITRCNDLAHHVVGQRLNKAVDEAKKARITAENAMAEANDNESKAWDAVDDVQKQLDEAQELNDTQAKRIIELEQQLKGSEKVITGLQNTEKQLKKQVNDTQANLESAEKRTSEAEGKLAEVRDQLGGVQTELKAERTNVANLTTEQKGLVKSIGALEGKLSAAEAQAEKAQGERDAALEQKARSAEAIEALTIKNKELQHKLVQAEDEDKAKAKVEVKK